MRSNAKMGILVVLAASTAALPQKADSRVPLGQLDDGSSVVFVQAASGGWGIEIAGSRRARFSQQRPADIEFYRGETDIRRLATGYNSVRKQVSGVTAQ